MNDEIVNTIELMRNYTSQEIYRYLLEKHHILLEDDFISAMQSLEADGIIYKREGSKYYHVSDDCSCTRQNPTSSAQDKAREKNMSLSSENAKKCDTGGGFLFLFIFIFVYPKFQSIPLYHSKEKRNSMLGTFG